MSNRAARLPRAARAWPSAQAHIARRERADADPWSQWTSRLALFALALVVYGVVAHRVLGLATPVLINLVVAGLAIAAAAFLAGLVAAVRIWLSGDSGAASTLVGLVVAGGMLGATLIYVPVVRTLPPINDVTTDARNPPAFAANARDKARGAHPIRYPGEAFAARQAAAYPDVGPLLVSRPSEEVFDLVIEALQRLNIIVTRTVSPTQQPGQPGLIEAFERTLIVGFIDDVAIRVDGDAQRARVDIRSASRFGTHDLGRNAARVRAILREVQVRLEATTPLSAAERVARLRRTLKKAMPKRPKNAPAAPAARRTTRDGAR